MPQNAKFSSRICQSALGKFNTLEVGSTKLGLSGVNLLAQAAAIVATPLLTGTSTTGGLYRVSYYHETSQAATTSGDSQLTLSWNDSHSAQSVAETALTNTLGNLVNGEAIIYVPASQNIDYAVAYSSSGATVYQFDIHLSIEKIG